MLPISWSPRWVLYWSRTFGSQVAAARSPLISIDLSFVMPVFLENIVGSHDAPIRCVEFCPEVNVMVTGSWDQTVKLWDPRTPCNAGTFSQPDKVWFDVHLTLKSYPSAVASALRSAVESNRFWRRPHIRLQRQHLSYYILSSFIFSAKLPCQDEAGKLWLAVNQHSTSVPVLPPQI